MDLYDKFRVVRRILPLGPTRAVSRWLTEEEARARFDELVDEGNETQEFTLVQRGKYFNPDIQKAVGKNPKIDIPLAMLVGFGRRKKLAVVGDKVRPFTKAQNWISITGFERVQTETTFRSGRITQPRKIWMVRLEDGRLIRPSSVVATQHA